MSIIVRPGAIIFDSGQPVGIVYELPRSTESMHVLPAGNHASFERGREGARAAFVNAGAEVRK